MSKADRDRPPETTVSVNEGGVVCHASANVSTLVGGADKAMKNPDNPWVANRSRTRAEILTAAAKAQVEQMANKPKA
jgi:hypothetical protein